MVLVSHDMPQVFEVADHIHVHRLGRRSAVVKPGSVTMTDVVSLMTGALSQDENGNLYEAAVSNRPHGRSGLNSRG